MKVSARKRALTFIISKHFQKSKVYWLSSQACYFIACFFSSKKDFLNRTECQNKT